MRAVFRNVRISPCERAEEVIERGALVVEEGKIAWLGAQKELPVIKRGGRVYDMEGRLITPSLIDCHSHVIYGGHRAWEFEERIKGVSYEEIALRGGGIMSTCRKTRALSEEELLASALMRVDNLLASGVGVLEIKSGYGLDLETELKMLRVAKRLKAERRVRIFQTFLGAHCVPSDYESAEDYIEFLAGAVLPVAVKEGLVDCVDIFCDNIGFSPSQARTLCRYAKTLGVPVRLHADQLSDQGGGLLAAEEGALSADHLEYLNEEGAKAMGRAGVVAVLLPGAFYYLGGSKRPPIEALRKYKVPLAIGTDCNPGSSPVESLLIAMNMAMVLFGLSPWETLLGVTSVAAQALGWKGGRLAVGQAGDCAIWNVENINEIAYKLGHNPLHARVKDGRIV